MLRKMLINPQTIDRLHVIVRDMRVSMHAPDLNERERKLYSDMVATFDQFERESLMEAEEE